MASERVEQREEARLVGRSEKAYETLRLLVKNFHTIGRWISHCDERREGNQILRGDRLRARFGNVTAGALIAGMRALRNILREPLIQPTGDGIGIKAMEDKM